MKETNLPVKFYNIGISYRKADVQTRGSFSLSKENQELLLEDAKKMGLSHLLVLSTCNRTEITGFAHHPYELISLICKFSGGSMEDFARVSTIRKGNEAIQHLFKIGVGLDSQILGDYEIVAQLKASFKMAKEAGTTNAYMERLLNAVLQASKEVKNNTKLSSGTTSVAYAAIQYVIEKVPAFNDKKILVYGLGKMGKSACKNLDKYTNNNTTRLVNRTDQKAIDFAQDHQTISTVPHHTLSENIKDCDILIVSTGSQKHTITEAHIPKDKALIILDLSMPENVDSSLKNRDNITLVNVDELSKITEQTVEERKKEIPKVGVILEKHKLEFEEWHNNRKFVPAVNALKASLQNIQSNEIDFHRKKVSDFNEDQVEMVSSRIIQKITTMFIKHLKDEKTSATQSIDVMKKVFNLENIES